MKDAVFGPPCPAAPPAPASPTRESKGNTNDKNEDESEHPCRNCYFNPKPLNPKPLNFKPPDPKPLVKPKPPNPKPLHQKPGRQASPESLSSLSVQQQTDSIFLQRLNLSNSWATARLLGAVWVENSFRTLHQKRMDPALENHQLRPWRQCVTEVAFMSCHGRKSFRKAQRHESGVMHVDKQDP